MEKEGRCRMDNLLEQGVTIRLQMMIPRMFPGPRKPRHLAEKDFEEFVKHPILTLNHSYTEAPIGRITDIEFLPEDIRIEADITPGFIGVGLGLARYLGGELVTDISLLIPGPMFKDARKFAEILAKFEKKT
jgi:hypothetical protein